MVTRASPGPLAVQGHAPSCVMSAANAAASAAASRGAALPELKEKAAEVLHGVEEYLPELKEKAAELKHEVEARAAGLKTTAGAKVAALSEKLGPLGSRLKAVSKAVVERSVMEIEAQIEKVDPRYVTREDRAAKGTTVPGYHPDIDLTEAGCSPTDLEFYYNEVSANSLKTKVALAEAGLPFVYKHIALTHDGDFETKKKPFLTINPSGTLPVLVHEGHPVYDSTEQVKFIGERSARGLYPAGQKQLIDEWLHIGAMEGFFVGDDAVDHIFDSLGTCFPWISIPMFLWDEAIRSKGELARLVFTGRELAMANLLLGYFGVRVYEDAVLTIGPKHNDNPFVQHNVWHSLRKGIESHLTHMESQLDASGGPFLCGAFSLADVSIVPFFQRASITLWLDELLPHFPVAAKWWDACKARPAYEEWAPKYGGPNAPHMDVAAMQQWIREQRASHPKFDAVYKGTYPEFTPEAAG